MLSWRQQVQRVLQFQVQRQHRAAHRYDVNKHICTAFLFLKFNDNKCPRYFGQKTTQLITASYVNQSEYTSHVLSHLTVAKWTCPPSTMVPHCSVRQVSSVQCRPVKAVTWYNRPSGVPPQLCSVHVGSAPI